MNAVWNRAAIGSDVLASLAPKEFVQRIRKLTVLVHKPELPNLFGKLLIKQLNCSLFCNRIPRCQACQLHLLL